MAAVVFDGLPAQPTFEALEEEAVSELLAPECGVLYSGLCEGAVQVEHPDESGPLPAPVGQRQDRAAMGVQTMK